MDCNPPGLSVHGILQARILEWVAIPSPEDLPDPGTEPGSRTVHVWATREAPGKSGRCHLWGITWAGHHAQLSTPPSFSVITTALTLGLLLPPFCRFGH